MTKKLQANLFDIVPDIVGVRVNFVEITGLPKFRQSIELSKFDKPTVYNNRKLPTNDVAKICNSYD